MTAEELDLARRLAAVPGIWRAGMLTVEGWRFGLPPFSKTPVEILTVVNARRIREGLSWRTVASIVGCAPSTLSRWSTGQGEPTLRVLQAAWQWGLSADVRIAPVPDLTDPATRGALLDVARNKHHTFASPEYLGADGWRFGPFRAESEGAAIALAILGAP